MSDAVDAIIGQWAKERPDLVEDLWPVQVLGRLQRLGRVLDKEFRTFAARRGLELGEVDVLTTLQRSGPPYALPAGALLKAAMVTSGAITNRIDRMEAKGLVERVREEGGGDRRTVRIRLTEHGHEVTREYMAAHLANEARMLSELGREESDRLGDSLRKLLESFGDTSIG
ncbi:MarR family transcriptional regulator [Streptomyces sp. ISL-99]|uniref:MarR family winged helix-turn-helix transcriptional regulator n=1 Tax=Streptomyces sp. ISL-99 TaxID=2819193 RepID=UPI001BE88583|nr:MarR family transcriptional regulator [Streptomyces sp. ISL-99]MBT2527663.1 MarR family transcriptional regulator [Streptomyces sp. ISL-99]